MKKQKQLYTLKWGGELGEGVQLAKEEHKEEELTEERALERESRNWAGSHSTDRSGDGCPT